MTEGAGKPNLKWCSGCRLPYKTDLSPAGCPRCAKDPELAERVRRDREREEQSGGASLLRGPTAALGWILALTAVVAVLTSLLLWDLTASAVGGADDSTAARFTMVVSGLSAVTYSALCVATFLGATLFAWIALGVIVLDLLVNGLVAVSYQSQAVFYALAPKTFTGALLARQLLKSN
jgi:hypothetical protein